jgi:hypothetical protein
MHIAELAKIDPTTLLRATVDLLLRGEIHDWQGEYNPPYMAEWYLGGGEARHGSS